MNSTNMTQLTESWYIPIDIFMIICSISIIILSILYLLIILFDKTCHTIPMILIANSCLSEFLFAGDILWMNIFALENDLKQIIYEDSLCSFRGYLSYSLCALQDYSYLLQAIYRYIIVVYPSNLFWQAKRTQLILIGVTWILAFTLYMPFLIVGEFVYNIHSQICQMHLRLSFQVLFAANTIYIMPVLMTVFIYFKLVRYIRQMGKRVIPTYTLSRAQRELKMVRRIVILVGILVITCFPYEIFVVMSFFTQPPKYHFRLAFISINLSILFVMIALFQFTDPLKTSMKKIINNQLNTVVPT